MSWRGPLCGDIATYNRMCCDFWVKVCLHPPYCNFLCFSQHLWPCCSKLPLLLSALSVAVTAAVLYWSAGAQTSITFTYVPQALRSAVCVDRYQLRSPCQTYGHCELPSLTNWYEGSPGPRLCLSTVKSGRQPWPRWALSYHGWLWTVCWSQIHLQLSRFGLVMSSKLLHIEALC
jgi:hypothetical protein